MVGAKGLEPSTSRSRTVRSSQLSYAPMMVMLNDLEKERTRELFDDAPRAALGQLSYAPKRRHLI